MTRWINKVSDRMLGFVVPKADASAAQIRIGCCDFCVCRYKNTLTGVISCLRCSCTICG